jgi:hypothetical protein
MGADDEIQLCGGHWVKSGPDGKPAEAALLPVVMAVFYEIAAMAIDTMKASPTPRVQAAAHFLEAVRADVADAPGPDGMAAARRPRDALARLAQTTDDPQVYAWAYRACGRPTADAPGACAQLSAGQWARLDPDNADPWLAMADDAFERNDAAALDDAMFHVAAAQRHRNGSAVLAATLVDHAPPDERYLLGMEHMVVATTGVDGWTRFDAVKAYCSVGAIVEPNRRETCERVAGLLAERSTSLMGRYIGEELIQRLGASAERLEAISVRHDAELRWERLRDVKRPLSEPMHCDRSRRTLESIRVIAEFGEVEAHRRDIAALGRPIAELAEETRRLLRSEALANEAAASAAAAASATAVAQR